MFTKIHTRILAIIEHTTQNYYNVLRIKIQKASLPEPPHASVFLSGKSAEHFCCSVLISINVSRLESTNQTINEFIIISKMWAASYQRIGCSKESRLPSFVTISNIACFQKAIIQLASCWLEWKLAFQQPNKVFLPETTHSLIHSDQKQQSGSGPVVPVDLVFSTDDFSVRFVKITSTRGTVLFWEKIGSHFAQLCRAILITS